MEEVALFRAVQNGRIFHTFCEEEIAETGRIQLDGRHLLFGEYLKSKHPFISRTCRETNLEMKTGT